MATWYNKGRTPVSVDTLDRGSVVITPRTRFQAHEHAVAHLVKAGIVVRIKGAPDAAPPSVGVPDPVVLAAVAPEAPNASVSEISAPLAGHLPEALQEEESYETEEDLGSSDVPDVDSIMVSSAAQEEAEAEREDVDLAAPEKKQSKSFKRGRR